MDQLAPRGIPRPARDHPRHAADSAWRCAWLALPPGPWPSSPSWHGCPTRLQGPFHFCCWWPPSRSTGCCTSASSELGGICRCFSKNRRSPRRGRPGLGTHRDELRPERAWGGRASAAAADLPSRHARQLPGGRCCPDRSRSSSACMAVPHVAFVVWMLYADRGDAAQRRASWQRSARCGSANAD